MGCTLENNYYNQVFETNNQKFIINGEVKMENNKKEVISGTLFDNLKKSIVDHDIKSFLFYKKENELGYSDTYDSFSFQETFRMSECLARNLNQLTDKKNLDLKVLKENSLIDYGSIKIVGVFSFNCAEYAITDLACQSKNITSCILPDHFPDDFYDYAISQTEIKTIFLSPDYISKFLSLNSKFKTFKNFIKNVVIFNLTKFVSKENIRLLTEAGYKTILFSDLLVKREENIEEESWTSNENSIVSICYSMGNQEFRGSMISNKGILNQLNLFEEIGIEVSNKSERFFSFLPISHIIERIHLYLAIKNGIEFYFISQSDVKKVFFEDIKQAKPTYLLTTPNYLLDINKRLMEHFDSFQGDEKNLWDEALVTKRREFLETKKLKHVYYDRHAFIDIKMSFGGEIKAFISCLAPLPKDICLDMKVFLSVPIIELYSLTEVSGVALHTNINDLDNNTCGSVKKGLKMKFNQENQKLGGEICFQSEYSFLGYFRNNELTKSIIDNDGWIHTGDFGELNNDNMGVKILGVKKEFFKLTSGKYISPRYLEAIFMNTLIVNQIAIFPCERNLILIAVVVLNNKFAAEYLKSINVTNAKDDKDLVNKNLNNEFLIKKIIKEFNQIANDKDLSGEERIYKVVLTNEAFTLSNGLISSFNIINRQKVFEVYSERLKKL